MTPPCASNHDTSKHSATSQSDTPVVVILGPTGSGKTALSIQIAQKLNGEIISADSRTIYKHLDIGTAKPTQAEQQGIIHHGLDLIEPGQRFTVADWKQYAEQKIFEIKQRGKLPIVVGGTGLYIDALIFDYHFHGPTGQKINDFEQKSCSDRTEVKGNYLLVGIDLPREELRERLRQRIEQMFTPELFAEYKKFVQSYGSDNQALQGNIYRFVAAYLNGDLTLDAAKEQAFYADYHLARRQLTWFKRNPAIHWLSPSKIPTFVQKNTHL